MNYIYDCFCLFLFDVYIYLRYCDNQIQLEMCMVFFFKGNMIEWCVFDDFELDGVEFKVMVSGFYIQQKDFV